MKDGGNGGGRGLIRAELIIAALALLTSAAASIAAILQSREAIVQTRATLEQTRTIANQLGASVWPYLTIDTLFSPTAVRVSITNQGLGPALIRSFTVARDNRVERRLIDVLDAIDANRHGRRLGQYAIGPGSVIRPSQSAQFFDVSDPNFNLNRAETVVREIRIHICYCSLLNECWTLDALQTQPRVAQNCDNAAPPIEIGP